MKAKREGLFLLIASNFPPIRGGSASVYANLAAQLKPKSIVIAPKLDYRDELPHVGWREHDLQSGVYTIRHPLLRSPLLLNPTCLAKARVSIMNLWIRARLAGTVLYFWAFHNVRTVCVGELLSGGWIFHLCRLLPNMRTIAYVHGEEITTDSSSDPTRRVARFALRAADQVVVVSKFTEKAVQSLDKRFAGKIHLIANGVDTHRFIPGSKNTNLLSAYKLQNSFIFVTVCRLVEKKGVDQLIRAFFQVSEQIPNARLLIVGSGPFRKSLESIVDELNLKELVVFAGDVPEGQLPDHYRLGDVFVMPNRSLPDGDTEGFGLVFLEANSCGLPVIAGKDGGSVEAVQHGLNGLVVDGRAVHEIKSAMLQLAYDEVLRNKLILGGNVAATQADWSSRAKLFSALIH